EIPAPEFRRRVDLECEPRALPNRDAEFPHYLHRQPDIGSGGRSPPRGQPDRRLRPGGSEEEGGQELAAPISRNRGRAPRKASRLAFHGRTSPGPEAPGIPSQGPDSVDERLDGPLSHARRSIDHESASAQGDEGGQESGRRSRITGIEVAPFCRNLPSSP